MERSAGGAGAATGAVRPAGSRAGGFRARDWIPPQHGAWAFLVVPLLLGASVAGWSWRLPVFCAAWVLAYPASFYLQQAVRARPGSARRGRMLRPGRVYGAATAVLSAVLLVAAPWLVWPGAVWAATAAASLALTVRGAERSFANDVLFMVQAVLALPVVWALGADPVQSPGPGGLPAALVPPGLGAAEPAAGALAWTVPHDVVVLTAVCLLMFVGSVVHVKSLIRERRDPRWRRASAAYAAVSGVLAVLLSPWMAVPFAFLLARTVVLGRRSARGARLRPGIIGAVEAVACVLLVAFGWAV